MPINLGEIQAKMTLDKGDFDRGLSDARVGLGEVSTAALTAASSIAALSTALAVKATSSAADFERAITEAGIKVQATEQTLQDLEGAALEAGKATKFTATESANALTFLGQAGFNASEQIEALPGVLELAAAENMNVARTADIASNILQGFGKETSELNDINDLLVKTSQSANTNVAELGQAMSFAAPAARNMGVSVSEAAAVVGQLSNAGIKAGRAGRGLRTVLAKMPEVARELGTTLSSSEVASLGLAGSLQKLQKNGLTADSALEQFGRRHGVVVQSILQEGIPALEDLTEEVRANANAAGKAAEKQLDTLSGKFEQLKGSVNAAFVAMGNDLKPAVKGMTDIMREHANQVSNANQSWLTFAKEGAQSAVEIMQVLGAAGGEAIGAFEAGQTQDTIRRLQQRNELLTKAQKLRQKGFIQQQKQEVQSVGAGRRVTTTEVKVTLDELSTKRLAGLVAAGTVRQQRAQREAVQQKRARQAFKEQQPGLSRLQPGVFDPREGVKKQNLVLEGLKTEVSDDKVATNKNTKAVKELTQAQKDRIRQETKVKATQRARSVVKQAQRSLKKPAAARDAVQAAQAAVGGDVTGATARAGAGSEAVADARQKARQLAGRTGQVQQNAKQVVKETNRAFDEQSRKAKAAADGVLQLAGALEQASTGQRKFAGVAKSIFGGITQGAAIGGGLGAVAGGATALAGIISQLGGQQTSRQKQQARQRREQRKQIKRFADRTAERLADEMEERQLQARVIRIDASGALVGSEREVSSRLGDLLENEVGRREGFNI